MNVKGTAPARRCALLGCAHSSSDVSEAYKLYLFPPFGYFVGPADMSYKEAKEKGLLYDIHTGEQVLLEQ